MASPKYSKIEASSTDESLFPQRDPSDQDSESRNCSCHHHQREFRRGHWMFSTFAVSFLLCLSLASNLFRPRCMSCLVNSATYETGFDTELDAVKNTIELVEYEFTGDVQLDGEGGFKSTESKFVGKPSITIDREWHALLSGLNIDLPISEAKDIQNQTYNWEDTDLYFSGLAVFHSLHCLDRLRQSLYPSYYNIFSSPLHPPRDMHIDHCIDHLRQAIQCHSDLTPMNWARTDDERLILKPGSVHTCRNFDRVHEWARERKMMRGNHGGKEKLLIID